MLQLGIGLALGSSLRAATPVVIPTALSALSPKADAWCWFHEPRAVSRNGKMWFGAAGADDNSVLTGRASLYEMDEASGTVLRKDMATSTVAATWADDHDYPSAPVFRPDGRLVSFYCPHRTGGPIYFRISVSPYTMADGWSKQYSIGNEASYPTYPSPVFLSGEGNKLYLFYRNGTSSGPLSWVTSADIATVGPATVDGGDLAATPTWAAEKQLCASAGTQGIYHKVTSNGVDRIDILMTDAVGAQAGAKNDVRHTYLTGGLWYTSAGVSLGAASTPIAFSSFTAVATSGAPDNFGDMWCDHIQRRASGLIEAVFHRFVSVSDHRLYYARYEVGSWSKVEVDAGVGMGTPDTRSTQITDGQGAVEGYYSPGAFLDTVDEGVLYCGVGTSSYSQLYRYYTGDGGATWTRQRVSGLAGENVRPVVPVGRTKKYSVLWMSGAYHYYDFNTNPAASDIGYTTRIQAASRGYTSPASAPANASAPTIAGSTGSLGNVLQAAAGSWTGDMPMTFAYQWIKAGVDIGGAISNSYTIQSGDVGSSITVRVTATNYLGSVAVTSAAASALPTNLLPNSQAFNLWTAGGITLTQNVANDPDGFAVADRIAETAVSTQHILTSSNMSIVSGQPYCFSQRVDAETCQFIQLLFGSGAFGSNAWADFNLSTGAVGTTGSAVAASGVIDEGDGWYRVWIAAIATGTTSAPVALFMANAANMARAQGYLGSVSNTMILGGGQVEGGLTPNTYVPT